MLPNSQMTKDGELFDDIVWNRRLIGNYILLQQSVQSLTTQLVF